MTVVAIVYHSGTDHTAALAQAVAEGARRVKGVTAQLQPIVGADINQGRWRNDAIAATCRPTSRR